MQWTVVFATYEDCQYWLKLKKRLFRKNGFSFNGDHDHFWRDDVAVLELVDYSYTVQTTMGVLRFRTNDTTIGVEYDKLLRKPEEKGVTHLFIEDILKLP
ncbi:MAG: hypothetical protein R3Y11_06705 [Pseudomonadota bacterium]